MRRQWERYSNQQLLAVTWTTRPKLPVWLPRAGLETLSVIHLHWAAPLLFFVGSSTSSQQHPWVDLPEATLFNTIANCPWGPGLSPLCALFSGYKSTLEQPCSSSSRATRQSGWKGGRRRQSPLFSNSFKAFSSHQRISSPEYSAIGVRDLS